MKGVYTALITPFDPASSSESPYRNPPIDFEAYDKLLDLQVEGGIQGVVPCGTTGEGPTLTLSEKKELIRFTLKKVRGTPVKVIANTGTHCTRESVELSEWAAQEGVHGVLAIVPYYNKPSQKGMLEHFLAIAEAIWPISKTCEVIPYLNPGRTIVSLTPESLATLAQHPLIRSVKESTGGLLFLSDLFVALKKLKSPPLDILSGNDTDSLFFVAAGGAGSISVASNLIPKEIVELNQAIQTQPTQTTFALYHERFYPLIRDLFLETNPVPIKYAVSQKLSCSATVRLPLVPLSQENRERLQKSLDAFYRKG